VTRPPGRAGATSRQEFSTTSRSATPASAPNSATHASTYSRASGFLVKDTAPVELLRAMRAGARGDALLSPGVTRRLIGEFANRTRAEVDSAVGIGRGFASIDRDTKQMTVAEPAELATAVDVGVTSGSVAT
jgi:DNA-binding NarL/FixJ family response regulator